MSRTILIVDDSKVERVVLNGYLKAEYDLIEAASGEEAIELLRAHWRSISAIVMDIVMPGMDGFEALKIIKANSQWLSIPVIITTGLDDDDSREKAIALGADSFVIKPFNRKLLLHMVGNALRLREMATMVNEIVRDSLTGLLRRDSFFTEAERMIRRHEPGYYTLSCIDIENFKVINDQYGTATGDEVLKHVAQTLFGFVGGINGLCGRYMADKFAVLYPAKLKDSDEIAKNHTAIATPNCIQQPIRIRIGRYLVSDTTIPASVMFDRAAMAGATVKGRYDTYVGEYNEKMREDLLHEQQLVGDMKLALGNGEFEPWFQPQYNHATGALIGAEALVRWRRNGKIIPPNSFVPVFERNGFIYEVDRSVWRQVCALLRRWLDCGKEPLPISVNISRYDLFQPDFMQTICGLVDEYELPIDLLRLEITESAFAESTNGITKMVGALIEHGFTVEIDDFGSGYSSLNTLKDVPASILKLDMRFFETTDNSERGGNIVGSVVRMAKWLGMAVIAEGVEEKAQADYLKSIGCYYIQGYYYAKPMPTCDYEAEMGKNAKEAKLSRLETLKTLDSNLFWDPNSMETLIFNSYVGGACIFEYTDGKTELLRINEQFVSELHGLIPPDAKLNETSIERFLDEEQRAKAQAAINRAIEGRGEGEAELRLTCGSQTEYIRIAGRIIARADNRVLIYGVIHNITEQREAQQSALINAERISAIMDNTECGITAFVITTDGKAQPLFINNRFYELIGYTPQQYSEEVKIPFDLILAADRKMAYHKIVGLQKVGQSADMQLRAVRRDGSVIWLRVDISIVKFANVPHPVQLSNFVDVTEQVQTEQEREEAARQLQIIMGNVNGSVSAFVMDDVGNTTPIFCNENYYKIYGYTKEQAEAIQLDVMSCVVPEDFAAVVDKLNQLKRDGVPIDIDYRAKKSDGSEIFVRCIASRMSMERYGDQVIVAVATDFTEQHTLQDQLSAIVENINGGVSVVHMRDGMPKFLLVNQAYFEIIGYTKEQFYAELTNAFNIIHPDDRARVENLFTESASELKGYTMEYRIVRRNGAIRHVVCNTTVMRLFGVEEPVQLSVVNDITLLREAQQKEKNLSAQLRAIMENINGGVAAAVFHDADNIDYIFTNDGFYAQYGYTKEQLEEERPNVFDLILPDDREKTIETIKRIIRERGSETFECRCRRRDGSIMWAHVASTAITLGGISDTVLLTIVTDVTKLRLAELQSIETADRLQAVMNAMTNGITALTIQEHVQLLFANDCYYHIHGIEQGISTEDALPKAFMRIDADDRTRIRDTFMSVKEVGQRAEAEYRVNAPDGAVRFVKANITVTSLIGVDAPVQVAIYTDVTEERKSSEQLRFLNKSASQILAQPDSEKAINDTLCRLLEYFAGERSYIFELDDAAETTDNTYEICAPGVTPEASNLQGVPYTTQQYWFDAFRKSGFIAIPDVSAIDEGEAAMREILLVQGIRSIIVAPLWRDGKLIGYVGVDNPTVAVGQVGQLIALADYIAVLLTRRDLTKVIERGRRTMQQLMDDTPGGFLRMRIQDGKTPTVVSCNAGFAKLLGMTAAEVMANYGDDAFKCLFAEDTETVVSEVASALKVFGPYSQKCRLKKKNGGFIWVHVFGRFVKHENGDVFLNAYFADITEQKKTEQIAIELLDNMPSGAALFEYNGSDVKTIHINRRYWELVGRKSKDSRYTSPLDAIHYDDRALVAHEINSAIRHHRDAAADCRLLCDDGGYRLIHITANIEEKDVGRYLIYASYTPVSDESISMQDMLAAAQSDSSQSYAEAIREQLLDNLPFGAAVFNYDGKRLTTIHYNKQYSRSVNSEWVGPAAGLEPVRYIYPDDRQMVFDEINDAIAKGRNAYCMVRLLYGGDEYRSFRLDACINRLCDGTYMIFVAYTPIYEHELNFKAMLPLMFEKIMESATDLAFAKDTSYRYICCSKSFAKLLGLASEKDVVGKTDYELFPKEIADMFRRDDSALFATEKPMVDIQEMLPSPDGTAHYVRTTKHLLRSGTGEVIGTYCTGREITEIREAYAQLKLLTDSATIGIATFRCTQGSIETLYYNDGVCNLAGCLREEFVTRNISIPDLIFEDDRTVFCEQLNRLMSGETNFELTVRLRARDKIKWINITACATDHIGDVYNVCALLTDVTAQQEEMESLRLAGEEYRIATNHANLTICRYNIADMTLSMSQDAAKRLSLPEQISGVPYEYANFGHISPDTKDAFIAFFEGIIGGKEESSAIYRIQLPLGIRWVEAKATTVFDALGKPFSAIIYYSDITEQMEKEAIYGRWQNSIAERPEDSFTLLRCNLSKNQTFDTMDGSLLDVDFTQCAQTLDKRTEFYIGGHVYADDRERFRAFLRADTMLAEYYRGHRTDTLEFREFLPDGNTRWLKLSVDLVEYPNSTDVQAYLMFENIDEQKRTQKNIIERAETDSLTGLLNRATFAARANRIMSESRPDTKHALLLIDIDGLKLVNNVFGYSAGDRTLLETAELLTSLSRKGDLVGRLGGDEFMVFLSDIPNEIAIAKKARQLCELIRKDLGLDVRISASIGIAMFPRDGEGFETLFKTAGEVLLSVKDSGKNGYAFTHDYLVLEADSNRQQYTPKSTFNNLDGLRRILIVDDSKVDLEMLFRMFKNDFRVEKAADGATALIKLRHYGTAISAVLLDLNMPGMDGHEVLQKIKQNESTRTIPVIVVSSDDNHQTALNVIRAGADDLIVKPFEPDILRVRVEAAIVRAEHERLRVQKIFMSLRNAELYSYKSALERSGIMVIALEWGKGEYSYSPSVSGRLAGEYDGKPFWRALLTNMVTDVRSVQSMQQLVHDVAEDRKRTEGDMTVRLKTAQGVFRLFKMGVFKEVDDFGLAKRILITLQEIAP